MIVMGLLLAALCIIGDHQTCLARPRHTRPLRPVHPIARISSPSLVPPVA